MTRVYGQLFKDGRAGNLVLKPSRPFFGVPRHEQIFPVTDGHIDLQLTPTPPGHFYLVGFKQKGDVRRTDFTLKWRIPDVSEVDISSNKSEPKSRSSAHNNQAQVLINTLNNKIKELEDKISEKDQQISGLSDSLSLSKRDNESLSKLLDQAVVSREKALKELADHTEPLVKTEIQYEPLADDSLLERIGLLEERLKIVVEQNNKLESTIAQLHQLQLKHGKSAPVTNQRLTDSWLRQNIRQHLNNTHKSWP